MTKSTKPRPFDSDSEYLDAEFEAQIIRARRIGSMRQLLEDGDARPTWDCRTLGRQGRVSEEETRLQIDALRVEERRLREHLDARVRAHRADTSRQTLGIDVLAEQSGLSADERTILLACTAMAVSNEIGRQITEGVGGNLFSRMEVETAIRLLEPRNVGDWLRFRRLFHRTGALVGNELVTIEFPSTVHAPTDVLGATVEVTSRAFSVITVTPHDDDPEGPDTTTNGR